MKKGLVAGIGGYLTILITTLQTIIITRKLGPEDIGSYAIFRQFCLLGAQVVTLGIPSSLIYFISVKKRELTELLTTNIIVHIACSLCCLLALIIFNKNIVLMLGSVPLAGVIIPFGYILFIGLRNYFYNALLAGLYVKKTVLIDLLPICISFICLLLFIVANRLSLFTLLAFDLVITPLLGSIIGYLLLKRDVPDLLKQTPAPGLFFKQAGHGFWMNLSDILMLLQFYLVYALVNDFTTDTREVGFYARAFSVINIFITSLMYLVRYFYASWSRLDMEAKKNNLARVLSISFIISGIAALFIGIFSTPIVVLLFGKAFITSSYYLDILIIAVPANIAYLFIANFNNSEGQVKLNAIQLAASIIVFYLLAYFPFKHMGISGIAYAYVTATCVLTIISFIVLTLRYKIYPGYYFNQLRLLIQTRTNRPY